MPRNSCVRVIRGTLYTAAFFASLHVLTGPTRAEFPVPADEADKLKACEVSLCKVIIAKGPADGNLSCNVTKTWSRSFIENGVKERKFTWGFGDARCSMKVELPNAIIVKALTEADYVLDVPPQTANCEAETGKETTAVKITIAPKVTFKAGVATVVKLGIGEIDAPSAVKGVIWSAAKIEDTVGLFQTQLLKEVNKFVTARCPEAIK